MAKLQNIQPNLFKIIFVGLENSTLATVNA